MCGVGLMVGSYVMLAVLYGAMMIYVANRRKRLESEKDKKAGRILTVEERANQSVESGEIIIHRQEGSKFLRGENVGEKADGSIYAFTSGIVKFVPEKRGEEEVIRVHVRPSKS